MKERKRSKKSAIIAVGMAAALLITGALAFFTDQDTDVNRFSFTDQDQVESVDIEVEEPNWDPESGKEILPGATVSKDPILVNDSDVDAFGYITVLVPTAKEIKIDTAGGVTQTQEDVELFSYTVNGPTAAAEAIEDDPSTPDIDESAPAVAAAPGWVEVAATVAGITNEADVAADDNIYFTAHTYAYVNGDGSMAVLPSEAPNNVTSSVFADLQRTIDNTTVDYDGGVTFVNASAGEKTSMTYADIVDSYTNPTSVVYTVSDGQGGTTTTTTAPQDEADILGLNVDGDIYALDPAGSGFIVDVDGNKMYTYESQFEEDDNLNIYVTGYAIQADELGTTDKDAVWAICANAQVDEGETFNYFAPIASDIGAQGTEVNG